MIDFLRSNFAPSRLPVFGRPTTNEGEVDGNDDAQETKCFLLRTADEYLTREKPNAALNSSTEVGTNSGKGKCENGKKRKGRGKENGDKDREESESRPTRAKVRRSEDAEDTPVEQPEGQAKQSSKFTPQTQTGCAVVEKHPGKTDASSDISREGQDFILSETQKNSGGDEDADSDFLDVEESFVGVIKGASLQTPLDPLNSPPPPPPAAAERGPSVDVNHEENTQTDNDLPFFRGNYMQRMLKLIGAVKPDPKAGKPAVDDVNVGNSEKTASCPSEVEQEGKGGSSDGKNVIDELVVKKMVAQSQREEEVVEEAKDQGENEEGDGVDGVGLAGTKNAAGDKGMKATAKGSAPLTSRDKQVPSSSSPSSSAVSSPIFRNDNFIRKSRKSRKRLEKADHWEEKDEGAKTKDKQPLEEEDEEVEAGPGETDQLEEGNHQRNTGQGGGKGKGTSGKDEEKENAPSREESEEEEEEVVRKTTRTRRNSSARRRGETVSFLLSALLKRLR